MEKAILVPSTASVVEKALQLWACSVGIGEEVQELMAVRRDLCSVLAEVDGKEIRNEALAFHLREASHQACRVEDLLGMLEYHRIREKVERSDNEDHHRQQQEPSHLVI
ncbi:hypothetical protein QOZ80_5BG0452310 [Eleusine coracana subsp. coracana]|nr:hypothetical protein QOZ80_5BG0452310 [Eleusine coracana subsp. coracana]